jgi:hypothetical protein
MGVGTQLAAARESKPSLSTEVSPPAGADSAADSRLAEFEIKARAAGILLRVTFSPCV